MHHTLIVTDDVTPFCNTALTVLTFQDYLAEFPKLNEPKTRVINLCDTSRYLSEGYYCSLLAQARSHSVLPSVNTINDMGIAEEKSIDRIVFSVSATQDKAELSEEPLLVLFGMYTDYYDDHTDALRMQKVLVPSRSAKSEVYPWYQQTTDFTCGPSALMMAMCALDSNYEMSQQNELALWRKATTIFMMSGHGGCHPVGLALAAYSEGFSARVIINQNVPLFVDGVRNTEKKAIVESVEMQFMQDAKDKQIEVEITDWHTEIIDDALRAGSMVLCLISTYAFDKKKIPHWMAITSCDSHCYYLHDPDASEGQPVEYQHIPVAHEDFLRLASYGTRKVRTLVLLNPLH